MPDLHLEDISFSYRSGPAIISNMTATLPQGSITAVTGPSGCGKSTLLYLLGLMLRPATGRVLLGPDTVSHYSDSHRSRIRAESIGFVFQDAALDPSRSVLDNVLEPTLYHPLHNRRDRRTRALELLDRFGVRLPPRRRPGEISGGQAQRVGLCRALINEPEVMLADEPTGNLDPDTAELVLGALKTAAHQDGAAVVIVTHSRALTDSCDARLSFGTDPRAGSKRVD